MSAGFDPGHAAPDAVAAELAPDLAAIIGHLLTGAHDEGAPAALTGAQAAALNRAHNTLASFHEEALAWAAGAGPVPAWQSWANRLALALGELAGTLDSPPEPGARR